MIDFKNGVIEEMRNQKGDRALVAYRYGIGHSKEVICWIANNGRLRTLKSFNTYCGVICNYSEKAWKEQVKEFVTSCSKIL